VALGILTLVFCAANLPLLAGWVTERVDGANFFAPYYDYLARVVRSGHWLLWNPFSNAGSPDFAEPQIGALSPLTLGWALLAGPGALAFRLYWLGLWLLGGVGMFILAWALGAPVWGRLLLGMSFVFCGYYMGHAQHLSVVHAASFLPWIVWRLDRALRTGRRWVAGEAGALWGFSALAGNPALTICTGLFLGAWAGARVLGAGVRWRRAAGAMAIVAGVGVVVLAPAIFSFKYESQGYSDRSGPLPRAMVLESNTIEPAGLAAILSPYLPLLAATLDAPETTGTAMSPMYFGAAPLLLALLALATPGRRGWKWSVLALALLFLGCTLGTSLPLRGWLYDFVPPTRYFRHPNMFRLYFIFAVLVLAVPATRGIEVWRRAGAVPVAVARQCGVLAVGLALAGLAALLVPMLQLGRSGAEGPLALTHAALAWGGLATLAVALAVRPRWLAHFPAALVTLAAIDLLGAHRLSAPCAFASASDAATHPAGQRSPVELGAPGLARGRVAAGNEHLYLPAPVYCSYAALLNVQHMLSAESGELMRFALGPERMWFAPAVVEAPLSAEAVALLTQEAATRHAPVLLWHPRATMLRGSASGAFGSAPDAGPEPALDGAAIHAAPSAIPVPCVVQTYRADALTLRVTAPGDGWLLVTDRWSRSWQASVNGVEVPVDGGNFFFRLVPVRAGENVVAMRFEPFLLWPLLALSWSTLLVFGAAAGWRQLRAATARGRSFSIPLPCAASS